ncbi:MAG: PI-PLC domain-containing protein [Thermodesulfobacteriota bacterium]
MPPTRRPRHASLARLSSLLACSAVLAAAAPSAALDAYVCSAARRSPGAARPATVAGVAVADHFSSSTLTVKQPNRLCAPATLDGAPPADAATHLVRHAVRSTGRHPRPRGVRVENALGEHVLDLGRPTMLLAPSLIDAAAPPPVPDFASHAVDRYRCWAARAPGGAKGFAAAGTRIDVTDRAGATRSLDVVRPRHLCSPADVSGVAMKSASVHLACYDVRLANGAAERGRGLHVDAGFGAAELDTAAVEEVCLPSRAVHACNGAPELCDRRFDEVAHATTHNANSNAEDMFVGPNQQHGVARQLADGVRGLMLDTHYDSGQVMLCHAVCAIGKRPLVDTLVDIRAFLERHPYEVVSIIFESYVSAADTEAAFAAAGLLPHVHAQPVADPWPTLREMIAADRRLVVFTDNQGGAYPWYHHVWSYAFETHYSFANPAALSCDPNRGSPANRLFILNHFLTQVFGSPALAEQINHDPLFIERARECQAANDALPNFVTVDFYDIGNVFSVVAELNGLSR